MCVAEEMPSVCDKCGCVDFTQDNDVLDTWFSSWLWPFSTMGWPEKTEDLEYFLPTNLLVTAPEIIYLWVARMIMATLEFENKIPFDTVLLHGIVRDKHGDKLSKSKGNSPDPINIINDVGADALRFSIIYNTPRGQDSYYSDEILETGRNFCNKIWNAFRFIMMNVNPPCPPLQRGELEGALQRGELEGALKRGESVGDLADKWIYSRLNQIIKEVNDHYQSLRFNDAAHLLMQFIWDEFCSWYVEMAKERLYNESDEDSKQVVSNVMLDVMQTSMRLLHPIMPFISEEIWQIIKSVEKELMPSEVKLCTEDALIVAKFPVADDTYINMEINNAMAFIKETIIAIRNLRKQVNVSPAVNVDVHIRLANEEQQRLFNEYSGYVCKLAKVGNITLGVGIDKPSSSMVAVVQDIQIYLPLTGLIDIEAEQIRLAKQKDKLEQELTGIQNKLKNEKFVANAKPEIIEKEKEKELEVSTKLNTVLEVLKDIS